MIILSGVVGKGYGKATDNLRNVMDIICRRTGIINPVPGTLNVILPLPYYVKADTKITREEYNKFGEEILLQRCKINGFKGIIMRPDSHERGFAHGPAHIEIISECHLKNTLKIDIGDVVDIEVEGNEEWWNSK